MIDRDAIPHLADIPRVQAEIRPDQIALWMNGENTSYAELNARTNQVAHGLISLGVEPDRRVGFLAKNTSIYYELLFGAAQIRAALNGVNTRLAPAEVQYILEDAKISVLFVGADFYPMIEQIKAQCPELTHIIALDGGHADWPDFKTWRDRQSAVPTGLQTQDDDDIMQLYTSGTTGRPKGVRLTNRNFQAILTAACEEDWSSYDPGDVIMNAMPLFHVAGCNTGIIALAQGTKTVVLTDIDPTQILDVIETQKINHAMWVPAVILLLSHHPKFKDTDYSSLKQVFYGASPIAQDLLELAVEVMNAEFTQLYGLTETFGFGTFLPPEAHDPARGKLRSCGKSYKSATVLCVDEDDNPVPTGDVGEIVIKADFVMKGYWNNPEATRKSIRNGFFYTGDAGYFDEEGFLFIHDRVKDMIVTGGENVYPAEVENALFGHPDLADVAVIGIPDEKWGEAVKAIVVPKPGTSPTAEDIIAFARDRIAAYKCPKSVDFTDALPRNPSGKILRKDLREPYWQGVERRVG